MNWQLLINFRLRRGDVIRRLVALGAVRLFGFFPFPGADKVEDRPNQEDAAGNAVEQLVLEHFRIGGDPAVIQAPEAEAGEESRENVGA